MGKERQNRELKARGTEEGTAHERKHSQSPFRDKREMRKRQRFETVTEERTEEIEAMEEEAIEALLRDCQVRAHQYKLGGATTVEKNPGSAPGQAQSSTVVEGRTGEDASQGANSEAREAGMGRLPKQQRMRQAGGEVHHAWKAERELEESSQFCLAGSGRQHLMRCRSEDVVTKDCSMPGPRLALTPCRGVQPELDDPWGKWSVRYIGPRL